MNLRTEKIGGLNCHILDELPSGTTPRTVVVLCHGYGAPGSDLIPIGQLILKQPKLSGSVQFMFPEAPISLDSVGLYGGRAWWPIDMQRLQLATALGNFRELQRDSPPELATARKKLLDLIQQWSEKSQVPLNHFILGGFSQGSMLATDVTLQLDTNPAGLIILSGTLLNEETWRERAPRHKTLRVLQSHGTDDPILPFAAAGALRDALQHAGIDVEFISFEGGHEIPFEVLNRVGAFVRDATGDGRTAH